MADVWLAGVAGVAGVWLARAACPTGLACPTGVAALARLLLAGARRPGWCRLPSATTSSGCSITVGGTPSSRWSNVATSGTRLAPPTRNTPATCSEASLVQQRAGHPLELRPRDQDVADARHLQGYRLAAGEHLLGQARLLPQQAPLPAVLRGLRAVQMAPVGTGCVAPDVLDQERVEIEPAQVVDPVDGEHLEPGTAPPHDAGVEGTGAEVVHHDP